MLKNALVSVMILSILLLISCRGASENQQGSMPAQDLVKRGNYLTTFGGCHDCHSPKVFTEAGPIPDSSRLLSGAPSDFNVPPVPEGLIAPDKWGALASNDLTTWAGPWGTSFASNLTPDSTTGLGAWTAAKFIEVLRTGRNGEKLIMPPMPWSTIGQATDEDLKAIFAYLQSLKPIENWRLP